MGLQHCPGFPAHGSGTFAVGGKKREGLGKRVRLAGLDDKAASVLLHKASDFPIFGGDCDHRSTGGGDTIKFAGDDEAFQLGPQRYPMHIRDAQRILEQCLILIWKELKQVLEATLFDGMGEFIPKVPAPNEHEDDLWTGPQVL